MWFPNGILISLLFLVGVIKESELLRAQQAPCYEFICGTEVSNLCGSDNVTYLNSCLYSQAQCKNPSLFVTHAGPCPNGQNIQNVPEETDNSVEIEHVEVSTESSTIIGAPDDCADTFCRNEFNPVCGTDGISYSNYCQFTKARCRTKGLELKHEGRCKRHENCLARICPPESPEICGSDGKNYRNECELSIAKCYNPNLSKVSDGSCPEGEHSSVGSTCDKPCDDFYRPVCATDSKTYPNVCYFENAKCKNSKLKIFKFEPC